MRHIPNILSCFRILLIPMFVWQMLAGNILAAAGVLALSGLTDLLDGWLARRFSWVSAVGKVLDPVADKMTQVTVCVMLAIKMPQFWGFFALLLFKDMVMLLLGGTLVRKGVRLEGARWFGKVVTTLFYVIMVALLLVSALPSFSIPPWGVAALLSLVTVCAFAAGAMYIPQYCAYRKQAQSKPPQGGHAGEK